MFFDAANKSIASVPSPGTEMSKQALSLTEQNMKAGFEHARNWFTPPTFNRPCRFSPNSCGVSLPNAGEHMRQITGGVMSAVKDATKSGS